MPKIGYALIAYRVIENIHEIDRMTIQDEIMANENFSISSAFDDKGVLIRSQEDALKNSDDFGEWSSIIGTGEFRKYYSEAGLARRERPFEKMQDLYKFISHNLPTSALLPVTIPVESIGQYHLDGRNKVNIEELIYTIQLRNPTITYEKSDIKSMIEDFFKHKFDITDTSQYKSDAEILKLSTADTNNIKLTKNYLNSLVPGKSDRNEQKLLPDHIILGPLTVRLTLNGELLNKDIAYSTGY